MPKILLLALVCLFAFALPLSAAPAITVSGNSVTILGSAQTISLTCTLIDPNNTGMLRSGSNIITVFVTNTVTPGNVATCGPIYGNDAIIDGFGNSNSTYYKIQVFTVSNGIIASTPALQNFYAFTGSGTVDLATATPLAPSFMSGPLGSVVIPGSLTVSGTGTFKNINTILNASQFTGADIGAQANAAIAALGSTGGVVEIPCGTYSYSTPIVVNLSNVWLRGQGYCTVLNFTGTGSTTYAISVGNAAAPFTINHDWVTDLTLNGGGSTAKGIKILKGTAVAQLVQRNKILGFATQIEWGDTGSSSFDGTIRDNDLQPIGSQVGIDVISGFHSGTIEGNWIGGIQVPLVTDTTIGIRISGSSGSRITHNNLQLMPGGNVVMTTANGGVSGWYIGHNYFETNSTGGLDVIIGAGVNGTTLDTNYHNANTTPSNFIIQVANTSTATTIVGSTFLNAATAAVHNLLTGGNGLCMHDNNWTGTLIDSLTGVSCGFGDTAAVFPFEVNESFAGNAIARFYNRNATGSGVAFRSGANSNYALVVQDAGTGSNCITQFGDGHIETCNSSGGFVRTIGGGSVMGLTLKTGAASNYTGTNTTYVSVDTTNLCAQITVPAGWKLMVSASGVLESVTAAVAQSVALADAGTTCAGGGVTALNGTERTLIPPAIATFDEGFHTQFILTGDGAAHSISLVAKTSNAADAWGIQSSSVTLAPSMTFTLMPSN